MTQKEKAERFRALHTSDQTFVLPNAWDAASARLFEEAGFPAIGTTSAGIAFTLGYADGENVPKDDALFVIRRIVATVNIPVTADIEAGYGAESIDTVLTTVRQVIDAGAIGINLEDSVPGERRLVDKTLQVEKLRALRELGSALDIPLVINARTDAFHLPDLSAEEKLRLAVARANAYRDAGADCLFVPFVTDGATIASLAQEINGPLNVLVMLGTPSVAELAQLGVRRVSVGAGPHRATLALARRIAYELRDSGTYELMLTETISSLEMNQLFMRKEQS